MSAERRKQRIEALGSLASSAVTFVIFLVAILMILAEMGFNITTIVAGTSVVAVTLAFGLQSIVKDLVSGVFMLVEDQFGVGDYVDMEKAAGVVEGIGLRVTELRGDDGTVWYVRNGEVLRLGNFSQGGPGHPPAEAEPAEICVVVGAAKISACERRLDGDRRAGKCLGNRAVLLGVLSRLLELLRGHAWYHSPDRSA